MMYFWLNTHADHDGQSVSAQGAGTSVAEWARPRGTMKGGVLTQGSYNVNPRTPRLTLNGCAADSKRCAVPPHTMLVLVLVRVLVLVLVLVLELVMVAVVVVVVMGARLSGGVCERKRRRRERRIAD